MILIFKVKVVLQQGTKTITSKISCIKNLTKVKIQHQVPKGEVHVFSRLISDWKILYYWFIINNPLICKLMLQLELNEFMFFFMHISVKFSGNTSLNLWFSHLSYELYINRFNMYSYLQKTSERQGSFHLRSLFGVNQLQSFGSNFIICQVCWLVVSQLQLNM